MPPALGGDKTSWVPTAGCGQAAALCSHPHFARGQGLAGAQPSPPRPLLRAHAFVPVPAPALTLRETETEGKRASAQIRSRWRLSQRWPLHANEPTHHRPLPRRSPPLGVPFALHTGVRSCWVWQRSPCPIREVPSSRRGLVQGQRELLEGPPWPGRTPGWLGKPAPPGPWV